MSPKALIRRRGNDLPTFHAISGRELAVIGQMHRVGGKVDIDQKNPQLPKHLENTHFGRDREREQYEINPRACSAIRLSAESANQTNARKTTSNVARLVPPVALGREVLKRGAGAGSTLHIAGLVGLADGAA
jgi:hypothetical protein